MNITLTDRSASIMFPKIFIDMSTMDIDIMQDEGRLMVERFFSFHRTILHPPFSLLQSMN